MDGKRLGRVMNGLLDRIYGEGPPLSPDEKVIYCAYYLDAEVRNGGFDQFFFNSQGNLAAETLDALLAIGAPQTAALLRRACDAFKPDEPSPDRDVRWRQMDRIHPEVREVWHTLDEIYYASKEYVLELVDRYIETRGIA
jgi:hypothetical protein